MFKFVLAGAIVAAFYFLVVKQRKVTMNLGVEMEPARQGGSAPSM